MNTLNSVSKKFGAKHYVHASKLACPIFVPASGPNVGFFRLNFSNSIFPLSRRCSFSFSFSALSASALRFYFNSQISDLKSDPPSAHFPCSLCPLW
jgi:hypothetical protein